MIRAQLTKKPGGANNPEGNNQHVQKEVNHNNVMNDNQTKAIQGNSLDYTLARLTKEAPELREEGGGTKFIISCRKILHDMVF